MSELFGRSATSDIQIVREACQDAKVEPSPDMDDQINHHDFPQAEFPKPHSFISDIEKVEIGLLNARLSFESAAGFSD